MKPLRHCFIVGHVHDELIIECDPRVDLKAVCEQMGRSPDWMPGSESCRRLEDFQKECRLLIQDIHSEKEIEEV